MGFAVLVNHRVRVKERKKLLKYLDLARKLKKLLDTKMTVILIVLWSLGRVSKNLEKRRRELEIREICNHLHLSTIKIGKDT